MYQRVPQTKFTPTQYLAVEEVSGYRSEYIDGEIYAMAGGSSDHSLIEGNVVTILNQLLEPRPCSVYTSNLRLMIEQENVFTYPDAMIVCGQVEFLKGRNDTCKNPIVIVEVLSKSTRRYDRGKKFSYYKKIPTLQEYLLIDSERLHVEIFRREGNRWNVEMLNDAADALALKSVALEIPIRRLYIKVSWSKT